MTQEGLTVFEKECMIHSPEGFLKLRNHEHQSKRWMWDKIKTGFITSIIGSFGIIAFSHKEFPSGVALRMKLRSDPKFAFLNKAFVFIGLSSIVICAIRTDNAILKRNPYSEGFIPNIEKPKM